MDQLKRIQSFIKEKSLIASGDVVLLGLSGGADSMYLLYVLSILREKMNFHLYAMHIHHGIRGAEAERDLLFSEEMARRFSVPFFNCRVDAPQYAELHHMSEEEAARILRYDALRKHLNSLVKKNNQGNMSKGLIAVAHHQNDQAETVIHNIIRGSGLRGLRGMEAKHEDIIRPILMLCKEEILSECKRKNIPYVDDSTNENIRYTRNRIRWKILPEMEMVNERAAEHIAKTAELLGEANDIFEAMARDFVDRFGKLDEFDNKTNDGSGMDAESKNRETLEESKPLRELRLPLSELRKQAPLIRKYILMDGIQRLGTPKKDWESVHISDLDALLFKQGGAHLDLPYKMSGDIRKNECIIRVNREVISMKRRKKV